MIVNRSNFLVEIGTAVPLRWTRYRGFTADGRRGLIVDGNYYAAVNVVIPQIDQMMNPSPLQVDLVIGNAHGIADDLVFDAANVGAPVTITRLVFADTPWEEHLPPAISSAELWFEGLYGRRSFNGAKVSISCDANLGRRGSSPRTSSRTLMTAHTPPEPGARLTVRVLVQGG